MDDDMEDYDIDESIRSFRRAGAKVIEGVIHLYRGGRDHVSDQHAVVQGAITVGLWFAGNWVYNRTAPLIIELSGHAISNVPTESLLALVSGFLGGNLALSTAQLLGVSTGALLGQNGFQTRKLKRIETKVTGMNETTPPATDGGRPESETVGGGGLGGAIAGGSIGISFGPGGVLAGVYLGYVLGERLTAGDVSGPR